jgi:stearoyl-CoA desaturase (delta-9 desaturase)
VHSHIGWLFKPRPPIDRNTILDLATDPLWVAMDRLSPLITFGGLLLAGLFGALYEHTAYGFVRGMLWGGFVRMFALYHITWAVNSVCHFFGGRIAGQTHRATNHALFGILALGEGWHANHHEAPAAARHGGPGQLDLTYLFLLAMRRAGWVWDLRMPKGS